MSASEALNKFYSKEMNKTTKTKRRKKNKTPEADLEKLLKPTFLQLGLSLHKIEAKAVYNPAVGQYLSGQAESGMPDYVGNTKYGIAAFVEVKAPGKRATLKPHQRAFLIYKIMSGCFAVCVDSCSLLTETYTIWSARYKMEPMLARNLLLSALPPEKKDQDLLILE